MPLIAALCFHMQSRERKFSHRQGAVAPLGAEGRGFEFHRTTITGTGMGPHRSASQARSAMLLDTVRPRRGWLAGPAAALRGELRGHLEVRLDEPVLYW